MQGVTCLFRGLNYVTNSANETQTLGAWAVSFRRIRIHCSWQRHSLPSNCLAGTRRVCRTIHVWQVQRSRVPGQRTYLRDGDYSREPLEQTYPGSKLRAHLFDKNKTRIGQATLTVSNVGPGETVKFQTTIAASGPPVSLALSPTFLPKELGPAAPPRTVTITVNTVPQGAAAKLDGQDVGTTPKLVQVTVGKHELEFTKEGFNAGRFPFEIGSNDASGGSVSFELGTSAHDTVELRDGSVLSGDVVSLTGMEVIVKVAGIDHSLDRNQVKRISFVQRQSAQQAQ